MSDAPFIYEVGMSHSWVKLSTKCGIFFERATPIVVQVTDVNTLLMLHKSQKNVIYDEEIAGALYFPNLRLTILLLKIVKRGRFVQTEWL